MSLTSLSRLPNWLTGLRLALIPVFVILLQFGGEMMTRLAMIVFIFAAITDFVDGYIARKFGWVSDLGKLLDPLADKILVMAALVMLVGERSDLTGDPWVPAWMVVLVLAREIWVTGLRAVAASQGVVVAARDSGKIKSVLQMSAVVALLLHSTPIQIFSFTVPAQLIGLNLLFLSLGFSYWGAYNYTISILLATKDHEDEDISDSDGPTQVH